MLMASTIYSICDSGMDGLLVRAESHISNGLPSIIIVGLANKAVDEAKERLRSAFASSGITFPRKRITLNLAPADEPKDSSSLDLSMAISIIVDSSYQKNLRDTKKTRLECSSFYKNTPRCKNNCRPRIIYLGHKSPHIRIPTIQE